MLTLIDFDPGTDQHRAIPLHFHKIWHQIIHDYDYDYGLFVSNQTSTENKSQQNEKLFETRKPKS